MTHKRSSLLDSIFLLGATLAISLILPASAAASILPAWGSNLSATPTFDTANNLQPSPHDGADTAVWNSALASGSPAAPQGGQVLKVNIKGCARQASGAPTTEPNGTPVNEIHIQTLTPGGGGSMTVDQSSQAFTYPWCGNGVTQNTITTFQPLHMCVKQGEVVDFNDIGGFLAADPSAYPNGVPYQIIAQVSGSSMNSYIQDNGTNVGATFSPGTNPTSTSGWGSEPNEELLLQVIEGVGDDAYGLCPGGHASEPANSNQVICVYHATNPGDPYGTCNSQGQPVYAPVDTSPPTISGTPGVGQRMTEGHGTWTNSPYGYKLQWEDCDASGGSCKPISGATNGCGPQGGCYYPTTSDVGHTLRVEEWATNDANTEGPAVSAPTSVVSAHGSSGGGGSGSGSGGSGGAAKLTLSKLKLNPATFYAAKGTTVTYNLNKKGLVVFKVISLKTHKVIRSFSHQSHAGGNAAKLRGLKAGGYQLAAIVGGRRYTVRFHVKPSKKHRGRKRKAKKRGRRKHSFRLAADVLPF